MTILTAAVESDAGLRVPVERPTQCFISGGEVRWSYPTEPADRIDIPALVAFANIRSEDDILSFASRYGVLKVCPHGKPASHNPSCHPQIACADRNPPVACGGGVDLEGDHRWFREPVEVW